jgi:PPK2 family polyphosphate:nucleotide phosphotransferase
MHSQPVVLKGKIKLKQFDPGFADGRDKEKTKGAVEKLRHRIDELQQLLYANSRHTVILLFQGMDAGGKDGAIRSVLHEVNPAGVVTANFKIPSDEERAHDYLWRVHRAVPRYGTIGVFNRSHYEAVLVERILGLVTEKECSRRFEQIVAWERMLAENRVLLVKFFLHLSREEQAERLRERIANPKKNWKFSPSDLEARARWDEYMTAYEDMLSHTSHPDARWHLVPADRNWYRDFIVAETVVRTLEALDLRWPKPTTDLSKIRIK